MRNSLDFLEKTNKLKEMPRTGWKLMKVKNPETIAEHIFRVVMIGWVLGKLKGGLKVSKLIKLALFHDLGEVYAGDLTPFFYWEGLDFKNKKDRNILLKGSRLHKKEKEKLGKIKFEKERKSLIKTISSLKSGLKKEIYISWIDYEKRISKEAKFIKQIDRIETLIQSIEYFGARKDRGGTSWWEGTEEIVEDPLLLDFLHVIQRKFYKNKSHKKHTDVSDKKLENILDFVLEIGKLKRLPRLYWKLRGIKNPETVAGHIFTLMLMALVFGREKKHLNMEKFLKMALCHEITAVYTEDTIPYYEKIPKGKREREMIFETLPRSRKKKKIKKFSKDYRQENTAIKKIVSKLEPSLQKEFIQLWEEYRNRSSLEGNLLSQINTLAVLLQALLYRKENNKFHAYAIWEWAFEACDDSLCCELMDGFKRKFYTPK
ncbi:HD domain-containing protein [Patescibacteria group bacterium]